MNCQIPECSKSAVWREVDHYTQQGKEHVFFFYFCDEHKKHIPTNTLNHRKEFFKLDNEIPADIDPDYEAMRADLIPESPK